MVLKKRKYKKRESKYIYKPEYCDMLIKHMREGLSFESFAGIIGTHKEKLYNWAKEHKDFDNAKKRGFDVCRAFWEKIGRSGCLGKINNFNAVVWIFNMKNRFGWQSNPTNESGTKDEKITIIYNKKGEN